ncbi:CBS domain-containing protein [Bremerella sp. JC817]|uniref:CBS domain-containing protein n=1 Tax=Bremerella sp. JC817 TaxID=3231756 RepID=UPI00345B22EA
MVTRALRVVVVSEDRQHLRDCFDFFVACGYEVQTRCDATYHESDTSSKNDVLIYDHKRGQNTVSRGNIFKIAIVPPSAPNQVQDAITAGADDVVLKPVTPAKLLVRVRAAAAILEARVAISQQFGRDPLNTYPGEGAFLGTLQNTIEQIAQHHMCVCAVMFAVSNRNSPRYAPWLAELEATALPDSRLFELPGQRVAVVTAATSPEQVSGWAAELMAQASVRDTTHADQKPLEVCGSFVSTRSDSTSSQQMALVLGDRLNLALSLGEGLLIDDALENQWLPQHPTGSIFDGMSAQDIMRPTTIHLADQDTVAQALEKMRLWNAEIAPVFRQDGSPCGLIRTDDLMEQEDTQQAIGRYCLPNVPQVRCDSTFDEFVALFSSHDSSWLQVTRDGVPVGVIHCDDLTSMNSPVMVALP